MQLDPAVGALTPVASSLAMVSQQYWVDMSQRTLPAGFIAPCLPTKTDKLPSGSDWLHEIKQTLLTAVTDNAALTYLGSLVDGMSSDAEYALVAGAVTGGGLTVIANAPNPAGFAILKGTFEDGASARCGLLSRLCRRRWSRLLHSSYFPDKKAEFTP